MRATFVAAGAHNFGLVGNAFAMGAAIFLLIWGNTAASGISTFLGTCHDFPPFSR